MTGSCCRYGSKVRAKTPRPRRKGLGCAKNGQHERVRFCRQNLGPTYAPPRSRARVPTYAPHTLAPGRGRGVGDCERGSRAPRPNGARVRSHLHLHLHLDGALHLELGTEQAGRLEGPHGGRTLPEPASLARPESQPPTAATQPAFEPPQRAAVGQRDHDRARNQGGATGQPTHCGGPPWGFGGGLHGGVTTPTDFFGSGGIA
jgi:hypothetical protein